MGAKGNGEDMQDVAGGAVVEDEVDPGTKDAVLVVEEVEVEVLDSIPWRATSVGCVAIWPMTRPSSGGSSMSGSGTTLTRGTSSKSGRTGPGRLRGRGRHI